MAMEGPEITATTAVIDNGAYGRREVRFETGRLAQQAAGAVSGAGQQVEFMARIRHRLYLNIEAEIAEPACQQID